MPITIIKKADAPRLREEPIKPEPTPTEPVCAYVQAHLPREGFDGPEFDWMPKLWKCTVCGEYCKSPYWQGKPITECPLWLHQQAQAAKLKSKSSS